MRDAPALENRCAPGVNDFYEQSASQGRQPSSLLQSASGQTRRVQDIDARICGTCSVRTRAFVLRFYDQWRRSLLARIVRRRGGGPGAAAEVGPSAQGGK